MYRISQEIVGKKVKLDVKDKKILVLLSENSRMAVSKIAKKIRLSKDTVNYRIKRMKKLGVILRFIPEIRFRKLGYSLYHVLLLIDEKDKEKQQELIGRLKNHENTFNVMEYSDRWDLEWSLVARDVVEFEERVTEILAEFSDIIIERSKLVVLQSYYSILLPYHFYKETGKLKIPIKEKKIEYEPDKKDLSILRVLGNNCRASTYEIAKEVKLSADAIGLRIKKLVKSDIIKKFTILVNLSLLGYSWYTFAMEMNIFDRNSESKFRAFIEDHPYIIRAVKTLGTVDLLVYIIADNPKEFHRTIKQIKNEFSTTLKHYATFVAYKEHTYCAMPKVIN